MLPSPDILNEFEHGKFVLSNLAAKRAKQLGEVAPPLVQIDSNHPLTIALAEIAAGKIKPTFLTAEEALEQEGAEIALLTDEPLPAELGMLLPSLDEVEEVLIEDEEETETDEDAVLSLADLEEDEEETEDAPAAEDDDEVSLTEIEEKEASEEDESESEE
jgi:DNA-directed RNA polymerase subunit omega